MFLYLHYSLIKVLLFELWFPVQGEIRTICEKMKVCDYINLKISVILLSSLFSYRR